MELGMGPIPFLIDTRPGLDFSEVGVLCPDGQTIKKGMATFLQSAIKPGQILNHWRARMLTEMLPRMVMMTTTTQVSKDFTCK